MTDPLAALTELRPDRAVDDDWATTPAGQLCLRRARAAAASDVPLAKTRHPHRFKTVISVGAAAAVLAGAATAYGFASRAPADPGQVMCFRTASIDGDAAGYNLNDPTPQAALTQCSTHWAEMWPNNPQPGWFAVCVYPVRPNNEGGAQVVIPLTTPADGNSCQASGFDPLG